MKMKKIKTKYECDYSNVSQLITTPYKLYCWFLLTYESPRGLSWSVIIY